MIRAMGYMAAALFAASAAACDDSPTGPDLAPPTTTTESFTGILSAGGSGFYSFTVVQEGALQVTLTALSAAPLEPQSIAIRLGLGVPVGEGCSVSSSVTTAAGLSTQLLDRLTPGTYCIEIRDPGVLTRALSFIARIVHT